MTDDVAASSSSTSSESHDHPGTPDGRPVYHMDPDAIIRAIERAEHPDDDPEQFHQHMLPVNRLPGFGDPEPDCGDFIPQSMRFCDCCGDVQEYPHNCLRYDCPEHAPYAIRRRAAGSADAAGICPQLDALRRYLNAYRDDNQYFHHLTIEPPTEWRTESRRPLERTLQVVREIMDQLGIQGVVAFHSFKGDHEDPDANDLGEWADRLFSGREWDGDVRDELKPKGHFHVIGVAPYVDLDDFGDVYDETGWVVHRITQSDESNVSISDDEHMARAVTYALSHAGIYETETGQRRLAAWMKGPDVNQVSPTEKNKERMTAIVNDVVDETLGISSPTLKCDQSVPLQVHLNGSRSGSAAELDPEALRATREPGPMGSSGEIGGPTGPTVATGTPGPSGNPGGVARDHVDAVGGMTSAPGHEDLDEFEERSLDLDAARADASSTTSSSSTSDEFQERDADRDDVDDEQLTTCGGFMRHISQAGDRLLSREWRERAEHVDDLERAYRSYIDYILSARTFDTLSR